MFHEKCSLKMYLEMHREEWKDLLRQRKTNPQVTVFTSQGGRENCQKTVRKLSENCQKTIRKLSENTVKLATLNPRVRLEIY